MSAIHKEMGPFLSHLASSTGDYTSEDYERDIGKERAITVIAQSRVDNLQLSDPQSLYRREIEPYNTTPKKPPAKVAVTVRKVDSVWSKMSVFQKFMSIITLGVLYCCVFKPALENLHPQKGANFSSMGSQSKRKCSKTKLPQFDKNVVQQVNTQDLLLNTYKVSSDMCKGREVRESQIANNKEAILAQQQLLDEHCSELATLASGSDLDQLDFRAAIVENQVLDTLGITYYRFSKGEREVPKKHQKEIIDHYDKGVACQRSIKDLSRQNKMLQQEILRSFSSMSEFSACLNHRLPYTLTVNGKDFFQHDLLLKIPGCIIESSELFGLLADWAEHPGEIILDGRDPAFAAQYYLFQLTDSTPFTLNVDEKQAIKQAQATIATVPKTHRVALSKEGDAYVIASTRNIAMSHQGAHKSIYQWNETLKFKPQEERCIVEVQRNIHKIKQ